MAVKSTRAKSTSKELAKKAPWKKPKPKSAKGVPLTEAQKQEARTRAAKAGRRYPNLVDNMYVAKKAKAKAKADLP